MEAFVCDRCKKVFCKKIVTYPLMQIRIVDGSTARKEMSRGKLQDLCPECYRELKDWFYITGKEPTNVQKTL